MSQKSTAASQEMTSIEKRYTDFSLYDKVSNAKRLEIMEL